MFLSARKCCEFSGHQARRDSTSSSLTLWLNSASCCSRSFSRPVSMFYTSQKNKYGKTWHEHYPVIVLFFMPKKNLYYSSNDLSLFCEIVIGQKKKNTESFLDVCKSGGVRKLAMGKLTRICVKYSRSWASQSCTRPCSSASCCRSCRSLSCSISSSFSQNSSSSISASFLLTCCSKSSSASSRFSPW